jgi:general secretion pathway protein I
MIITLKRKRRSKVFSKGFTLLEVMIAISILAIAMVVILGLRNRAIDLNGYARDLTTASLLAQSKMGEWELKSFPDPGETAGDFGKENPDFKWRVIITPTPFDDLRELKVIVSWKRGVRDETLDLTTYLFQPLLSGA